MKTSILTVLGLGIYLSCITSAHAVDLKLGKQLVEENCMKCHADAVGGDGSAIYTRKNRIVDSLAALKKQVHRCKTSLGVSWPENQIDDVAAYLNKTYYKFKK